MDYASGKGVRRTLLTYNDAKSELSWTVQGGAIIEQATTNDMFFRAFKAVLFPAADKAIPVTAIGNGGSVAFESAPQQHTCGAPQQGKGVFGADVGAQSKVHSVQACCDACTAFKSPALCVASVYDASGSVCFFKDASWKQHLCNASSSSYVIAQDAPPTPSPSPPPSPSPLSLSSVAIARPCGADGGPTMRWNVDVLVTGASRVPLTLSDSTLGLCLDCGSPCGNMSQVRTQACSEGSQGQYWDLRSDQRLASNSALSFCLTALNSTYDDDIVMLYTTPCDADDDRQVFKWNNGERTLAVPSVGNQFGVAGVDDSCFAANGIDCDNQIKAAQQHMPSLLMAWCNSSKDATDRASALVAQMTMREKKNNLGTGGSMSPGQSSSRGPWWGEALHGLEEGCGAGYPFPEYHGYNSTGCPTSFPHGTALGATFNRSLWASIGSAIGREARGMWNQNYAGPIWFFSPADVNVARDPRWGRAQEVN